MQETAITIKRGEEVVTYISIPSTINTNLHDCWEYSIFYAKEVGGYIYGN